MKLYRINDTVYPDVNFAFTLTATGLGLAPIVHTHSISQITGLSDAIATKSDSDHEHACVSTLYVTTMGEGAHSKTLNIQGNNGTLLCDNNDITLSYTSQQTGIVDSFRNSNSNDEHDVIKIGLDASIDGQLENIGMLAMKENTYA